MNQPVRSILPVPRTLWNCSTNSNAKGATIIISTHDVELAYLWADQIILMNKGTVLHAGTPEEVFTDPALVTSSNLRMPAVLEVYTELVSRQMVEKTQSPKSVLQLVSSLEQSFSKPRANRALGTITVCNVDATGADEIRAWMAGHRASGAGQWEPGRRILPSANR